MKFIQKAVLALIVVIVLGGLSAYYLYQQKLIPEKVSAADQTMLKTDSMRFSFKVILLNQRAHETYLLGLKNNDQDLVYDALDFMQASLGFVFSGNIDNRDLVERVVPLIQKNIQLLESSGLKISDTDLQKLHENLKVIYWEAEQIEKKIWIDFQKDFVRFQSTEYQLQIIYQMVATSSLVFLLLLTVFYFRQRVLNRSLKSSQQALIDSEKQYRNLVETATVVVWEMDVETRRFVYMSPQIETLTGFAQTMWIDFDFWLQQVHPDDRYAASKHRQQATRQYQDHTFEYRMVNQAGKIRWIRDIAALVHEHNKAPVIRGYFFDITATKQAELTLRKNERWLSQVMETLPNGIQVCDIDGKITFSNPAHHNILGLKPGALTGHYVWDFLAEDARKIELREYLGFLTREQPQPEPYVSTNRTADGRKIDLEITWDYQRDDAGNVIGFLSVISDITNRKTIENKLLRNEKSLANAQKIAHVGSWELELSNNSMHWSDQVFRIFEIDKDRFGASYEAFNEAIHPDDRDRVNQAYTDSIRDKSPYDTRHRLLLEDGRIKTVWERGETEYDQDGTPLRSIGVVMDITELEQTKLQSEQSEAKFRAITEQSSEGITVADTEGNYIFVNSAFCDMIGYSEQELLKMTVFDVKAPEQDHSSFRRTKEEDEGLAVQVDLQRKDGTVFTSEVIGKMIDYEGESRVLGTVHDVSARIHSEKALKESERRFDLAMEVANDGIWDWHLDTDTVLFDKRYYTMGGYEPGAFPSNFEEWHKRVHQDDIGQAEEAVQQYLSGQNKIFDIEFRFLRQDGEYMWVRGRGKVVERDEAGQPLRFIGTHADISLLKEHEHQLLYQAHYDQLTGLPNRFLALDRLSQLINDAKRAEKKVAVIFLDLDDFKKVNDTLGHEIGDKLLKEAAERLTHAVRHGDTVCRLGGDEFIILMGGIEDSPDTLPIAENVLKCLRNSFHIEGRELILSGSMGIALYPQDGDSPSELLRNADSAMYHAKELGRNTYSFFTQTMNEQVSRRLEIEEQIHGALDRGEFSVFYQPKIDISDQRVIGAEALLRWNNPALGQVSPFEFIPIAEQTGLIVSIGQFVLEQALQQTAIWQKNLPDFRVAVNLSPVQFRDPDLVTMIDQHIQQSGVESRYLELEITEGVLMSGHTHIDEALAGLKQLGLSIAMDDFGTGYSSLGYLRNYPFDTLKIDKSFIRDINFDPADRELINAAVAMAHGLKLKVVAEGVETEEQSEYLKKINCDYAQGYLFSRPLSAEHMTRFL